MFHGAQRGFNHTVIVAKINDMQMKNKHEEIISNFFHGIQRDMNDEFSDVEEGTVTGKGAV